MVDDPLYERAMGLDWRPHLFVLHGAGMHVATRQPLAVRVLVSATRQGVLGMASLRLDETLLGFWFMDIDERSNWLCLLYQMPEGRFGIEWRV